MTQAAEITVTFMNMKKQQSSYDCGIYAIAYATALKSCKSSIQTGKNEASLEKLFLERKL